MMMEVCSLEDELGAEEDSSRSQLTSSESETHTHCASCIKVMCMFAACKVICCKECRHPHHACKSSEHALLCSQQRVLCINALNGCEAVMPRSKLGVHLASCPASIVSCSMDWSRTKTAFNENSSLISLPTKVVGLDNTKLDVMFAMRDYDTLQDTLTRLTSPLDPDPYDGEHRCTDPIGTTVPSAALHCDSEESVHAMSDAEKIHSRLLSSIIAPSSMSFITQALPKYMPKRHGTVTFHCGFICRRDEFADHVQLFHNDIVADCNGWLEHRCPLMHAGCMYSQTRFYPNEPGATIVYSKLHLSFSIKPASHVIQASLTSDDMLSELPVEVMIYLCGFLDSFALGSLSMVNDYFFEICESLLKKKGTVALNWGQTQNDGMVTWTAPTKTWCYSLVASSAKRWGFQPNVHMSEHLKNCPKNVRLVRTAPVRIPVAFVSNSTARDKEKIIARLKAAAEQESAEHCNDQ